MKTLSYNPSQIEVEFAEALVAVQADLQAKIKCGTIISVDKKVSEDNPLVIYKIQDRDLDIHEIVLKIIQRIE